MLTQDVVRGGGNKTPNPGAFEIKTPPAIQPLAIISTDQCVRQDSNYVLGDIISAINGKFITGNDGQPGLGPLSHNTITSRDDEGTTMAFQKALGPPKSAELRTTLRSV